MEDVGGEQLQRRLIVFGASNVFRGLGPLVNVARNLEPGPLDLMLVHGNGRSYGQWSSIVVRSLPGILQSDFWTALAERPSLPTRALITDIGNDLMFHVEVERLLGWVEACLERLQTIGADVIVAGLPTFGFMQMSRPKFVFFRSISVPTCRLTRDELLSRALRLDELLAERCAARGVPYMRPEPAWYGLDPIHVRLGQYERAWSTIMQPWQAAHAQRVHAAWYERALWPWLVPTERRVLGMKQHGTTPQWYFNDGGTLSIY